MLVSVSLLPPILVATFVPRISVNPPNVVWPPPKGLKGFTPVGPRPTESVLSPQGYASKELFANFEEIVPLDFGKPSGKSGL